MSTWRTEPDYAVRAWDLAAGLFWYEWTDGHPTAPFVLHLYKQGAKRPMATRYFACDGERQQHLAKCRTRRRLQREVKLTPEDVLMVRAPALPA